MAREAMAREEEGDIGGEYEYLDLVLLVWLSMI